MASVRLLAIGVNPFLLVFVSLNKICLFGGYSNVSLLSLHVSVIEDLELAVVLGLNGPELFFFSCHLFEELLLYNLLFTLVQNTINLVLVKALEVVALDSVRRKHRHLSGRVLSHKVVCHCVAELNVFLLALNKSLNKFSISLLFSENEIGLLDALQHGSAGGLMILLSLLEHFVECKCLVIECLLV
jgi:hypothetical protein